MNRWLYVMCDSNMASWLYVKCRLSEIEVTTQLEFELWLVPEEHNLQPSFISLIVTSSNRLGHN